ncbi:PHD finger protein ALFIN-LIKE 4-like [Ipomoea triloba]|uniref:PHD finger protein ALFIN-LIKE 4-like n=1 Tax=Ipomoea triloba TaxID=35885 RepID=UPI00125D9250|nr:PHD finger protein ALFIN-LIKE 4-like [Ipomoea triloba]
MAHFNPRSVEEVFLQFKGRRAALLRALTTDFDEVYRLCDPALSDKRKLSLYGHLGERWEVNGAEEVMHAVLPEPLRGINFARDRMEKREWLAMLAHHSDLWLLSVAFNFSSRFGHDKADRNRLFGMINELPTILEVVSSGNAKEPPKLLNDDSKYSKVYTRRSVGVVPTNTTLLDGKKAKPSVSASRKWPTPPPPRVCGECNEGYIVGDLWKRCLECQRYFHLMKCLKFTKDQHRAPLFGSKTAVAAIRSCKTSLSPLFVAIIETFMEFYESVASIPQDMDTDFETWLSQICNTGDEGHVKSIMALLWSI